MHLKYRKNYQFEVTEETYVHTLISFYISGWEGTGNRKGQNYYVNGTLLVADKGYRWNGWDSDPRIVEASLIRDVLYTTMKNGQLSKSYRWLVDREFRKVMKKEGVPFVQRWTLWMMTRVFGGDQL